MLTFTMGIPNPNNSTIVIPDYVRRVYMDFVYTSLFPYRKMLTLRSGSIVKWRGTIFNRSPLIQIHKAQLWWYRGVNIADYFGEGG